MHGNMRFVLCLLFVCFGATLSSSNHSNRGSSSGNYSSSSSSSSISPAGPDGPTPILPVMSCQRYQGDLCSSVVSRRLVFVANQTQAERLLENFLRSLIYVRKQECRAVLVDFLCAINFPKCDETPAKIHCPCADFPRNLKNTCVDDPVGSMLATRSLNAQTQLKRNNKPCSDYDFEGKNQYGHCAAYKGSTGDIACPDRLVQPSMPGSKPVYISPSTQEAKELGWKGGNIQACAQPCVPRIFTVEQEKASVSLVTTLAWISTIATALLFVVLRLSGRTLEWPERLQVFFAICVFFLSLSLTFATWIGYSDSMWCENKTLCIIQAAMIEYFGLALGVWWLAIIVNLFMGVHSAHQRATTHDLIQENTKWLEKYCHMAAWGFPAVCTFILLTQGKLGIPLYGDPSYCFIQDDAWEFAFFYVEISVFFVVGTILFGVVLYRLNQLRKLLSNEAQGGVQLTMWSMMKKLATLFFFIVAFMFTFLFMVIYQITLSTSEAEDRNAYDSYIQCQVHEWFLNGLSKGSTCELAQHPTLLASDLQSACLASMGIVTFVVFGLDEVRNLVKKLCKKSDAVAHKVPPANGRYEETPRDRLLQQSQHAGWSSNIYNSGISASGSDTPPVTPVAGSAASAAGHFNGAGRLSAEGQLPSYATASVGSTNSGLAPSTEHAKLPRPGIAVK